MASSSVMLVGPPLCPKAGTARTETPIAHATATTLIFALNSLLNSRSSSTLFKGSLQFRKLIAFSRDPHIKRGQQNDAEEQIGNEPTYDHDSEGPLRIRSDLVRQRRGQKSSRRYE